MAKTNKAQQDTAIPVFTKTFDDVLQDTKSIALLEKWELMLKQRKEAIQQDTAKVFEKQLIELLREIDHAGFDIMYECYPMSNFESEIGIELKEDNSDD